MARHQMLDITTDALITALVDRGILPAGTTKVSVYAGNILGVNHIRIVLANDDFDDISPIPASVVDVPVAIEGLGV